jgi:hypothetical protein
MPVGSVKGYWEDSCKVPRMVARGWTRFRRYAQIKEKMPDF